MHSAIERWRLQEEKKKQERRSKEMHHAPFEGRLFEVIAIRPFNLKGYFELRFAQDKTASSSTVPPTIPPTSIIPSIPAPSIPAGEYVMATGKVIAKKLNKYNVILDIEVITSKGVGYLPRNVLRGPLVKKQEGEVPKLITDY